MNYKLIGSLALVFQLGFAYAITPVVVKEDHPNYMLDIQYPQGFEPKEVNPSIKLVMDQTLTSFYKELAEDADTPADAPGKTGLNITYTIPYQAHDALSVRFDISIFHRGAAHPANSVMAGNYINGKPVQLADLFIKGADYLKPIAAFCNKELNAKKVSDSEWINQGTKPIMDNYKVWYFTGKGIVIVFTDVAPYAAGVQSVEIPLSVISPLLKPELIKTVWGH